MFVVVAGAVVFFAGVLVLTLGISAIVKLIQKEYKLRNAINDLGGENPLDVLFQNDNLYDKVDRDHLNKLIEKETLAERQAGLWGKIKNLFSSEKKESARFVKEIYRDKKQIVKMEEAEQNVGQLEQSINKEYLSRAKSAYRILKTQASRARFQKTIEKTAKEKSKILASEQKEQAENAEKESLNSTRNRRKGVYDFEVNVTRLQRVMMFFKVGSRKQYQPSKLYKAHLNQSNKGAV